LLNLKKFDPARRIKMKRSNTAASYFSVLLIMLFAVSAVLCSQKCSASDNNSEIPQTLEELKARIDSLLKEHEIPGAGIAFVSKDSIIWAGGFGLANLETGEPVTENTHFRIGSCTKSFIGIGFLKLIDEGRIDLNTPVKEIAPEIEIYNPWQDTHPVRVVHLLEHTAGFDDSHLNWFYFEGPVIPLQRALEIKADLRRVRWPPGTRCSYSSPGYTLAGYILEKVSGQPYEDYIKKAIFDPIGMKTSTIGRANECKQLLSSGYGKNVKPIPYWYDYDEPAGAMNSSAKEMALFVQFMLNRGRVDEKQIISGDLIDKVGKPTTTIAAQAGLENGYSFGVSTWFRHGLKWYGHGGLVPGFYAEYAYNRDCGLGYVILINRFGRIIYDDVTDEVEHYSVCDVDTTSFPSAPVSENQLKGYCGYYEPRSPRMKIFEFVEILLGGTTILFENDTLYQQDFMSDKKPLIPVSLNMFRRSKEPEASRIFTKIPEGKMVYATKGSYYEKTAGWKPLLYRTLVFGAIVIMVSSVVYALFWIPVHLYKKLRNKKNRSKYLRMRIIPLFAVISLVLGFVILADQTILEFGQMTIRNIIFFISTLVFAGLSGLSLFISYRSFFKPVEKIARIYAVILSSACLGMTIYFGYWGIIGLRLWAY
jgi:CubicO group peptidase (beta-lactamase class C family)